MSVKGRIGMKAPRFFGDVRVDEFRFWKRAVRGKTENECWVWVGRKNPGGYGYYTAVRGYFKQIQISAHRISFALSNGYFPKMACHTCDNRACVNPAHLYEGDALQNNLDTIRRKRRSQAGVTRIKPDEVREMRRLRAAGVTCTEIGRKFNRTPTTISEVVRRITYSRID